MTTVNFNNATLTDLSISTNPVLFGTSASAGGTKAIAIANSTTASGNWSIAIGNNASASSSNTLSIGRSTTNTGQFATVVGYSCANSSGEYSTAIGYNTSNGAYQNSVAVGSGLGSNRSQETMLRAVRLVRATLQTTDATANQNILTFATFTGETTVMNATITAYSSANGLKAFLWRDILVRGGNPVRYRPGSGVTTTHDPDTLSYSVDVIAFGNNIRFRVTGAASDTVDWTILLWLEGFELT